MCVCILPVEQRYGAGVERCLGRAREMERRSVIRQPLAKTAFLLPQIGNICNCTTFNLCGRVTANSPISIDCCAHERRGFEYSSPKAHTACRRSSCSHPMLESELCKCQRGQDTKEDGHHKECRCDPLVTAQQLVPDWNPPNKGVGPREGRAYATQLTKS